MCNVPIKKDIRTRQDVLFLIGSIINRQTEPFSVEDIAVVARNSLKGSPYKISHLELYRLINHEIDILYRNSYIKMSEGKYINNDSFIFA